MKKAEVIFGMLTLVAITLNLLLIPGGVPLSVLCLSTLAMYNACLSFALFNEIRLRDIFQKTSYQGISLLRIIGAILTGISLSVVIIGILFKIQNWTGSSSNLTIGLTGLCIALIVGLIKYLRSRSPYYSRIFVRIAVFGSIGLFLLLLPADKLLEVKYRNHPDYVEAVKHLRADPYNDELRSIMQREREKMKQE
jgi:hypothetical protein